MSEENPDNYRRKNVSHEEDLPNPVENKPSNADKSGTLDNNIIPQTSNGPPNNATGKRVSNGSDDRWLRNDVGYELNKEFHNLYESFRDEGEINLDESFRKASFEFFDEKHSKYSNCNDYFNNFIGIWVELLQQRSYRKMEEMWDEVLNLALEWEEQSGKRLHKGTPYYFQGVTSILNDKIDMGFFSMHQALKEDKETHQTDSPDAPARYFVMLNPDEKRQAFRKKVVEISDFLKKYLDEYKRSRGGNLTFQDFRSNFLTETKLQETAFNFVYNLFKLELLTRNTENFTMDDPFASVYQANLLFSLCRIIENQLRFKLKPYFQNNNQNKDDITIYRLLEKLEKEARWKPSSQRRKYGFRLGEIKKAKDRDFEGTLKKLLLENYYYKDRSQPSPIQMDMGIVHCLRNFGAHEIKEYSVIHENFQDLAQRILNVLFYAVEVPVKGQG